MLDAGRRVSSLLRAPAGLIALGWVGLVGVYLATGTAGNHSRQSNDTLSALIPAWSLGQRGTLDIPDFYGFSPWIHHVGSHTLSDRMPGIILWATPFYALFGTSRGPSPAVAALAAAVATATAIICLWQLFSRLVSPRAAAAAAGLAAFGTATWTVSGTALWAHGIDQLFIGLALLSLSRNRFALSGLAFAMGIITRPHLAVGAAISGIWASVERRSFRPALVMGLTSSLGLAALVLYNRIVFGQTTLLVGVYAARTDTAHDSMAGARSNYGLGYLIQIAGTLISPARGVLVLSPFLLLLIPGLRRAWGGAPSWVRSSAVAALVYMAVQLTGNGFSGGTFFYSYRLPIEALTLASPLLVLAWREWTSRTDVRRVAFAVLAVISVAQHAIGAFIFTDSDSFETRAWSRYLAWEGLRQADAGDWLVFLACTALASFTAIWLLRRSSSPSLVVDAFPAPNVRHSNP
jgi:alpha-1,2-mannosyltransferase